LYIKISALAHSTSRLVSRQKDDSFKEHTVNHESKQTTYKMKKYILERLMALFQSYLQAGCGKIELILTAVKRSVAHAVKIHQSFVTT